MQMMGQVFPRAVLCADVSGGSALAAGARVATLRGGPAAHATASESDRAIGLLEVTESEFPSLSYSVNSCLGLSTSACARASCLAGACAGAAARVCSVSSSSAAVAHAHASTLHGAHNSWSDTARVQGPTGTREGQKVGFPAEDLLPVSEVGGRGKFSAGAGGCTGAGCRFTSRKATRHRYQACQGRCGHTFPSTWRFLIPSSCHLGADWASGNRWAGRRCVKPQSRGFGCQQGNAIVRMLFENLDHLRAGRRPRGSYETAWVTPGHDCLCSYQYGHGASYQTTKTNGRHLAWGCWFVGQGLAPLVTLGVPGGKLPTGVNLNRYSGPSSCIRWHSDNEPLFGPQNAPKLIVSMSLGNSVEFKVRRGHGKVPSLITLDHGDPSGHGWSNTIRVCTLHCVWAAGSSG